MHSRIPPAKPPRRKLLNSFSLSGDQATSGRKPPAEPCQADNAAKANCSGHTKLPNGSSHSPADQRSSQVAAMHEKLPEQPPNPENSSLQKQTLLAPNTSSKSLHQVESQGSTSDSPKDVTPTKVFGSYNRIPPTASSTPVHESISPLRSVFLSPSVYLTPSGVFSQQTEKCDTSGSSNETWLSVDNFVSMKTVEDLEKVEEWHTASLTETSAVGQRLKNVSDSSFHQVHGHLLPSPVHKRYHSDPILQENGHSSGDTSRRCSSFMGHPSLLDALNAFQPLDAESGVSSVQQQPHLLVQEVKKLQETNEKLRKEIHSLQQRLDSLEEKQISQNARHPESKEFSDLVAQIYYAQKERESAMLMRMNLAVQERDMAFQQIQRLTQAISSSGRLVEPDSSEDDEDIGSILKVIDSTQSPSKLLCHRDLLLKRMQQKRAERSTRLKQQQFFPKKDESVQMDLLYQLLSDQDLTPKMTEDLKDDLEAIKIYCRLHQSSPSTKRREVAVQNPSGQVPVSEEQAAFASTSFVPSQSFLKIPTKNRRASTGSVLFPMQVGNTDSAANEQAAMSNTSSELRQLHLHRSRSANGSLCSRREDKHLQTEFYKLQVQLEEESRARKAAEERCEKLERLVTVLRKKMNGLSATV